MGVIDEGDSAAEEIPLCFSCCMDLAVSNLGVR